VFVTRFQFFARLEGIGEGLPQWTFELAVLARAVILIACVLLWKRRVTGPGEPQEAPSPAGVA
jgi:hypothetical protein